VVVETDVLILKDASGDCFVDMLQVFVGETECDVEDVTNTQIVCEIEDAGTVHQLTNEGTTGCKFGCLFN